MRKMKRNNRLIVIYITVVLFVSAINIDNVFAINYNLENRLEIIEDKNIIYEDFLVIVSKLGLSDEEVNEVLALLPLMSSRLRQAMVSDGVTGLVRCFPRAPRIGTRCSVSHRVTNQQLGLSSLGSTSISVSQAVIATKLLGVMIPGMSGVVVAVAGHIASHISAGSGYRGYDILTDFQFTNSPVHGDVDWVLTRIQVRGFR
jgi:hypothetical protein